MNMYWGRKESIGRMCKVYNLLYEYVLADDISTGIGDCMVCVLVKQRLLAHPALFACIYSPNKL